MAGYLGSRNIAVVLTLKDVSSTTEGTVALKLPGEDKHAAGPVRIVVIAEDKHRRRVLGVAEQTVG